MRALPWGKGVCLGSKREYLGGFLVQTRHRDKDNPGNIRIIGSLYHMEMHMWVYSLHNSRGHTGLYLVVSAGQRPVLWKFFGYKYRKGLKWRRLHGLKYLLQCRVTNASCPQRKGDVCCLSQLQVRTVGTSNLRTSVARCLVSNNLGRQIIRLDAIHHYAQEEYLGNDSWIAALISKTVSRIVARVSADVIVDERHPHPLYEPGNGPRKRSII